MMAALYVPGRCRPRILRYHLGPSTEHTVYEAEIVATILGVELLRTERQLVRRASIALDNTAAISASTLRTSAPGRYLTDIFHAHVKKLKDAHPGLRLTLRWVPGHEGVAGNEAADKAAKEAAAGRSSATKELPKELRKRLPHSASRARQNYAQELKTLATHRWTDTPRARRIKRVDDSLPSGKYAKLVKPLARRHAASLSSKHGEGVERGGEDGKVRIWEVRDL